MGNSKLYDKINEVIVGDILYVNIPNGNDVYGYIKQVDVNEIIFTYNDKLYILTPKTAIDGDKLTVFEIRNKQKIKHRFSFVSIIISDKNHDTKIKLVPEDSEEHDSDQETRKNEDLSKDREEILRKFNTLDQYDNFKLNAGDIIFDKEGNSSIKKNSESSVEFEVDYIDDKYLICTIVPNSYNGKYKQIFSKYHRETFYFYLDNRLFNTSEKHIDSVAIQIFHGTNSSKPILFKSVYFMETKEDNVDDVKDSSDDDDGNNVDFADMLKDKDLARIMKHQSGFDKLLGRKPKGVKPIEDIKKNSTLSTLFGFNKEVNQRVQFIYYGDTVTGNKIQPMKNGNQYKGYMLSHNEIKRTSKTSKEFTITTVSDTIGKDNTYKVTTVVYSADGKRLKDDNYRGKIQIIK